MSNRTYSLLFLCTGNSARSILAEALANHWGQGRLRAYSAGSMPAGAVHPLALALLEDLRMSTQSLRSKGWEEFAGPGAPHMDFIITVCDRTAGEVCPMWPGQPITAHWGIADPAAVEGDQARRMRAFRTAFYELETRIRLFTQLPLERLDRMSLQRRIDEIGGARDTSAGETA